ncbi:uncharacterized protein BP01DRAFT_360953 [Aspergillus saccharolyticus JOP 1030-1]|uniref:Uncharacterized protein n=1 Tax=Aspergillus saccharolyticus JOP 1030-1 TaxID=1450539 RepID=A0A318ZKQ5_9EURO|nr:hypothetical protein BP01DRAFT_360953 [Aspergillus saccharolyticus JOP 1030-1]PYH40818.1 hypothetical protein BP01DRAFT_360953 [Aspergillus saccharolyticus JOP 1030-1]
MQLKSLLVAFALSLSVQAAEIKGWTVKDCKGNSDNSNSVDALTTCSSLESSKWKSLKAAPGDFVLTAYKDTKCAGTGYALQPDKCINGEFASYEAQFISTMKKRNTTEIIVDDTTTEAEPAENTDELK